MASTSLFFGNSSTKCQTSYDNIHNLPRSFNKIIVIISGFLMVFTIIFNSFNVFALVVTKQLNNPSMRLIFYLSLTDTCIGLIGQPLDITVFAKAYEIPQNCLLKIASESVSLFLGHFSAHVIALIGFDRYFRIRYLNRYSLIVKTWKIQLAIGVSSILSLVHALIHIIGPALGILHDILAFEALVNLSVFSLVILPYILSIFKIKQHRQNASNRYLLASVDRCVTSTATCIVIAVIIMYLPYVSLCIFRVFLTRHELKPTWFFMGFYCSYLFLFANSMVNALIFLSYNVRCRKVLFERGRRISRWGLGSGERPIEMRISHSCSLSTKNEE